MERCVRILALVCCVAAAISVRAKNELVIGWQLTEHQPDIPNGGRANSIAVKPALLANNDVILVASESGGLFRTTNRGADWDHIDAFPEFKMSSVVFLPSHFDVALATVAESWTVNSGAGVWRSTDSGLTWTQMPLLVAGAFEISIAPDTGAIWVATTSGAAVSVDDGLTWTMHPVFSFGDPKVVSVLALSGGRVIAGGKLQGIRVSADGGSTWTQPSVSPSHCHISDIHAFAASPFSATTAYVANSCESVDCVPPANIHLWYTEDAGDHWTQIPAAPGVAPSAGGIAFVKAIGHVTPSLSGPLRSITLYVSNRAGLAKLTTPAQAGAITGFDYTGPWTPINLDHGDVRDLAFSNTGAALLLATDGGLHSTNDGGLSWTFTGGGSHGYNALQINQVKDQWITDARRHDLYFAAQDNAIWVSSDEGTTWTNNACCEGGWIEREHRVATSTDSKVTMWRCGPCQNSLADVGITNVRAWSNPTGPVFGPVGTPKMLTGSMHVQKVLDAAPFSKGFASTSDLGTTWKQFALLTPDQVDIPKQIGPVPGVLMYQGVRAGFNMIGTEVVENDSLARIMTSAPLADVVFPLMKNFGGLGMTSTLAFPRYLVFATDPANWYHLIAPDLVSGTIKETWDGGDNWTEISKLTAQVTDNGRFLFRRGAFPFVSAISFSPDDPNLVALGTMQNGIFISADRGATWAHVPDSERAMFITSIEWKNLDTAYVSTYGRGLWKLATVVVKRPFKQLAEICILCTIQLLRGIDPATQVAQSVIVFGGAIRGGKIANHQLRELVVSPGSSVGFLSDSAQTVDLNVTESDRTTGFGNVAPPPSPQRQDLRGFTLDSAGNVLAAVYSEQPLRAYTPTREEMNRDIRRIGTDHPPTEGKPYIEINAGASERFAPLQSFEISGRSFPGLRDVEIAFDGTTARTVKVRDNGTFVAKVVAPAEFGLHTVVARDPKTRTVLDVATFAVVHEDVPGQYGMGKR